MLTVKNQKRKSETCVLLCNKVYELQGPPSGCDYKHFDFHNKQNTKSMWIGENTF